MTKNVISALASAARGLLLRDWSALLALAVLYAALVGACGLFLTTREATTWQVTLTFALAALIPLLAFVVAAGVAAYGVGESRGAVPLVTRALKTFWKTLLVSLPVLALVVLTVWGTNKLENRVRHDPAAEAGETFAEGEGGGGPTESAATTDEGTAARRKPKVRWAYVFVSALRLLLLGLALPLLAAHLWLSAARDGLGRTLRRTHRLVARAYSPRSVFTYAVGMIVFALVPYFLITTRTPVASSRLEVGLFAARVGLAFLLTLFGGLMTLAALARGEGDDVEGATDAATAPRTLPDQPRAEVPAGAAG